MLLSGLPSDPLFEVLSRLDPPSALLLSLTCSALQTVFRARRADLLRLRPAPALDESVLVPPPPLDRIKYDFNNLSLF